jgi:hypothetical protein
MFEMMILIVEKKLFELWPYAAKEKRQGLEPFRLTSGVYVSHSRQPYLLSVMVIILSSAGYK